MPEDVQGVTEGNPTPEGEGVDTTPPNPMESPEVQAALEAARAEARDEAYAKVEPHLSVIGTPEYRRMKDMIDKGQRPEFADQTPKPTGDNDFNQYMDKMTQDELIGRGFEDKAGGLVGNYVKRVVGDALQVVGNDREMLRKEIKRAVGEVMGQLSGVRDFAQMQEMLDGDKEIFKDKDFRMGARDLDKDVWGEARKIKQENPHLTLDDAIDKAIARRAAPEYFRRVKEAGEKATRAAGASLPPGAGARMPFELPKGYDDDGNLRTLGDRFGDLEKHGVSQEDILREILPDS